MREGVSSRSQDERGSVLGRPGWVPTGMGKRFLEVRGTGEHNWEARPGLYSHLHLARSPLEGPAIPGAGTNGREVRANGRHGQGMESDGHGFKSRLWHILAMGHQTG